ncbi:hypothetical protein SAY86_032123 [Trapa natans]|uniref:Uncharacterized protein n=1 Tax=Trapa natans TaxID=22666 RepID=A0AAN7M8M8_TRANT|nr:hypothetical protein SAY86_032123 [Trapa natans]
MSVKLRCVRLVVISSAPAAREVMQKHDLTFSDRNISSGSGPPTTSSIRSYGCLSPRSGGAFGGSVVDLLGHVRQCTRTGQPIDIRQEVFSTALNVLSNTFFSVDLAKSDTAREFKSLIRDFLIAPAEPNLSDFFLVHRHMDIQGIRGRMSTYNKRFLEIITGR